jgi:hypothetical protein
VYAASKSWRARIMQGERGYFTNKLALLFVFDSVVIIIILATNKRKKILKYMMLVSNYLSFVFIDLRM